MFWCSLTTLTPQTSHRHTSTHCWWYSQTCLIHMFNHLLPIPIPTCYLFCFTFVKLLFCIWLRLLSVLSRLLSRVMTQRVKRLWKSSCHSSVCTEASCQLQVGCPASSVARSGNFSLQLPLSTHGDDTYVQAMESKQTRNMSWASLKNTFIVVFPTHLQLPNVRPF